MSAIKVSIGAKSKVTINGTRCGVVSGTINIRADTLDSTDTEVNQDPTIPQGRQRIPGLYEADITIQGLYATDVNPHNQPFLIVPATYLATLAIDVHGLANPYVFRLVLIDDCAISTANPNAPNSWNFHGYTAYVTLPS